LIFSQDDHKICIELRKFLLLHLLRQFIEKQGFILSLSHDLANLTEVDDTAVSRSSRRNSCAMVDDLS
jgi:hypothetical protein